MQFDPADPRVRDITRELRVAPIDRSGTQRYPQYFNVWWTSDAGTLVAPRFWALEKYGLRISQFKNAPIDVEFSGALRGNQVAAMDAVTRCIRGSGGAVLSLATGEGKTCCACWLIGQLKQKTVILVHKDVLRLQWAERLAQFLPAAKVSFVQGTNIDLSGDVIVAMLQTVISRPIPFERIGMLVVDECFPCDQKILTEEGPMDIGKIYNLWRRGQPVRVQSFNETTQHFELRDVTHAWEKHATELVKISYSKSNYRATSNHPVLTTEGWKPTGELVPGDLLISRYGTLRVDSTQRETPTDTRVYDLEVQGTHTFVCSSLNGNGPVVHNCHHIAAETFSTAMRGLHTQYTLGLSATPERKDGLTKVVHWFLGPLAYASKRENMTEVTVEIVRYSCDRYKLPPPMNRAGKVSLAEVITDMADDPVRTNLIIEYVKRLREDPDRIVLVLSHRRDQCTEIASRVEGAVAFIGGSKVDASSAPVVCATFAFASEGYDDPRLNALVLATPASDVTQAVGRILRGTATKPPVIVDIQDDFSIAYAQSAKRKAFYAQSGFRYASQLKKEYPKCFIID